MSEREEEEQEKMGDDEAYEGVGPSRLVLFLVALFFRFMMRMTKELRSLFIMF